MFYEILGWFTVISSKCGEQERWMRLQQKSEKVIKWPTTLLNSICSTGQGQSDGTSAYPGAEIQAEWGSRPDHVHVG